MIYGIRWHKKTLNHPAQLQMKMAMQFEDDEPVAYDWVPVPLVIEDRDFLSLEFFVSGKP